MKETKIYKISSAGHLKDHVWQCNLVLPNHLADWDVWDYWEKERFDSMKENLSKKDVVFDVGTEQGALSALIAKYITGNLVLIEPSFYFWATIKSVFEANNLAKPLSFYCGFASNKNDKATSGINTDWIKGGEVLMGGMPYRYIHKAEKGEFIPSITMDNLSKAIGIIPNALNIDVEGAELLVLQGSKQLLKKHHVKVWVSVHADLMARDYNTNFEELDSFMKSLNYTGQLLATDHEAHWYYTYNG